MRQTSRNEDALATSVRRLSTGLRINSARDDAAGLAISERFTSQIKGFSVAKRNLNDAISLSQTVEGAMQEISSMLQRGRELSVQAANGVYSTSDRLQLQEEVGQLLAEVDRITRTSEFNGTKLFSGGGAVDQYATAKQEIVNNLKRSWLEQSESILNTYFGLTGDNQDLTIVLDDTIAWASAYVSGNSPDAQGRYTNIELHIDVQEMIASGTDWPNDSLDQLIAHEMTHAVMYRAINAAAYTNEKWFMEGTAEFIPGGDSRTFAVLNDLVGEGAITTQGLVDHIDNIRGAWAATHRDYAAAYMAVKYLDSKVRALVDAGGMAHVMSNLSGASLGDTLENYFTGAGAALGYTTFNDFVADYKANGAAFIGTLNLSDADNGAIGGTSAGNLGRDTTDSGSIPDVSNYTSDPLAFWNEIWPTLADATPKKSMVFQVGPNKDETIEVELFSLNRNSLGLQDVNIADADDAATAIALFDFAIDTVTYARSTMGAVQNRLEHTMASLGINHENLSASRSRILDTDYAVETASMTQSQILTQAANAMMAQANTLPQIALALLR